MDVYTIVTEKIIGLLDRGIVPWRRPWVATGLPRNLLSKRTYRGVNLFLLSASNYTSPYWLTMRQANQLGGHVKKGEESTIVTFWKTDEFKKNGADGEPPDDDQRTHRRFVLRFYRVFNLEQCELPQTVLDKLPRIETHQHDRIETAERIIVAMPNPPEFVRGGAKAFYSPLVDRVTLPPHELFKNVEEEIATAYHELSHSTGHHTRLNRKSISEAAPFGSPVYSFEEILAEMSAAYLCAEAGISPAVIENEAAYIQGWLKQLRDDRRMVVRAAAQAQRAADYILGRMTTAP